MRLSQIVRVLTSKQWRFRYMSAAGFYNNISDKEYLEKTFKNEMDYPLNLKNPQSFNEKIQWLKLYDRKTEYTQLVDKYSVRQYVADKIGKEYLVPLLGAWNSPDEIDFDILPNQFVLKCNHNSGLGMCICRDKSALDIAHVKRQLKKGLRQDYYLTGREWPYKNVQRKIIAEKYLGSNTAESEVKDYKFMCFNGKVKCSFVCSGRSKPEGLHVTFFDNNWVRLPFTRHYPSSEESISQPYNFRQLIALAEKLAEGICFVRVDFYEIEKKIYFGELTFYPGSGLEEFIPVEWDYTLGSWISLH